MNLTYEQILDYTPPKADVFNSLDTRAALVLAFNALGNNGPAKATIAMLLQQQGCEHLERGCDYLTDLCDVVMFG